MKVSQSWMLEVIGLVFVALAVPAAAQQTSVTLGALACLPQSSNGVLNATVSPEVPGSSTRLYFRRMNVEVEDFYYIQMEPAGGGGYWATFPVPTESKFPRQKLDNYSYEGRRRSRTPANPGPNGGAPRRPRRRAIPTVTSTRR